MIKIKFSRLDKARTGCPVVDLDGIELHPEEYVDTIGAIVVRRLDIYKTIAN